MNLLDSKEKTIWETMSDKDLMLLTGTNELDKFGIPKVEGIYNAEGERLAADGKPYGVPKKGFFKTIYNTLMPGDKFDFKNPYSQPFLFPFRESSIINGRATNYPITRTYDDGYGMF